MSRWPRPSRALALTGADASRYRPADRITVVVTWSEAVELGAGTRPAIAVGIGAETRTAAYVDGAGTVTWRFRTPVIGGGERLEDGAVTVASNAWQAGTAAVTAVAGGAAASTAIGAQAVDADDGFVVWIPDAVDDDLRERVHLVEIDAWDDTLPVTGHILDPVATAPVAVVDDTPRRFRGGATTIALSDAGAVDATGTWYAPRVVGPGDRSESVDVGDGRARA